MSTSDKVNSITVFLITKNDYTSYKDLVVDSLTTKPIKVDDGELFYRTSAKDNYPSWVTQFFGDIKLGENKKKLGVKTLSAVYFTNILIDDKKLTFAIAFGYGRYLIKPEFIKHDFGLETSRHAIDASRISSMRTITYDSNIKDKTIHSAADIRQSDFFLNPNTDVLTSVRGKVRMDKTGDLLMNRTIGGKDSVSITAYVDVNNIKELLQQLYLQYNNDGSEGVKYESNIKKLTQSTDIKDAEELLQKAIETYKKEPKLFFNLPLFDIKDYANISTLTIEGKDYKELPIEILDTYTTVQKCKDTTVIITFDNGEKIERKLFQFLYAELEKDQVCYLLTEGVLYFVEKNYKQRVESFYKNVPITTITDISTWDGCSEGDYNKKHKSGSILVLDEKFVFPKNRDRFEICDLLTKDKQIVHVKIYNGASQPLGHLFNQGMLSAQCMADDDIRTLIQKKINEEQTKNHKTSDFSIESGFNTNNYTVTFLILCSNKSKIDTDNRPKIPFLAKAVFKENYSVITGLGYKVALACIGKDEESS